MNNQINHIQYQQFYLDLDDNHFLAEQYYPTLKNVKIKLYEFIAVFVLLSAYELYILFLYTTGSNPTYVSISILPNMIFIAHFIFISLDLYRVYKGYKIYKSLFNTIMT
jgi:hypothetical protein